MKQNRVENPKPLKALLRNPFFWGAVVGVVAIPLLRPACKSRTRRVPEPPPVLGKIPDFALVDQYGKPFGSKNLKGHVTVVDFFFTSCGSICPRLTRQMLKLQKRFEKKRVAVRLLSITVDPETDTPAQLLSYARKYGADLRRWTFITGKEPDVRALIEKGFKTAVGEKKYTGKMIDIAHTAKFVIVDQEGRNRGYYSSDDKGIDEIFHRAQHVLLENQR